MIVKYGRYYEVIDNLVEKSMTVNQFITSFFMMVQNKFNRNNKVEFIRENYRLLSPLKI